MNPRSDGPLEPWEVFRQEKEGEPMRHGGSVLAPDSTLALHYAREMFGRRQESIRLWVVRRAEIHELEDPDLLQPPVHDFGELGYWEKGDLLVRLHLQRGGQEAVCHLWSVPEGLRGFWRRETH